MKEIQSVKKVLKEKVQELEKLISKTKISLKNAPEGALVLSRSNGVVQYYHKTHKGQKKGKYIPTKDRKLAASLAQKDYDIRFLKFLETQKRQVNQAIKLLPAMEPTEVYAGLSETRKNLVTNYVLTDEEYVKEWLDVVYDGKLFTPDLPEIWTEQGERVRSKSEKMIADKLYTMGIPYRYECPVNVKGYGRVYPDFTLLRVDTREEFYLEHFGMMDNPEYCEKAIMKLESYAKNGIYPDKNLLLTFETYHKPLNMRSVEHMIREFLL